jgi:protein-tyrosine kinase
MNRVESSGEFIDHSDRLRDALIAKCKLSDEAIKKISEVMAANGMTFGKAALYTGLVTQREIDDSVATMRNIDGGGPSSFVESAIRKMSSARFEVVVRENTPVSPDKCLSIAHEPDSARSEKIRALRTELLLLSDVARSANVIAVVSAETGEGRSQLSAELAISFAQLGRRTLLVDADLRKPQLHKLFCSDNAIGLSQALSTAEKPETHPVAELSQMWLLKAGQLSPNPLELLSGGRFQGLLSDWKRSYEFVVIDTPPISLFADGLAVATMAERALVVTRTKHTTFVAAKNMMRRLETTQAKVMGAIINHF